MRTVTERPHVTGPITDAQLWEIVDTRAYDYEVYDPEYAEVVID